MYQTASHPVGVYDMQGILGQGKSSVKFLSINAMIIMFKGTPLRSKNLNTFILCFLHSSAGELLLSHTNFKLQILLELIMLDLTVSTLCV
jgi:hypothetical protein